MLTKRTLLTAAHCLKSHNNERKVILGQNDLNDEIQLSSRQEIEISHVTRHPEYNNETAYFDVAIIHTNEDIDMENGVKPVCLSDQTFETADFLHKKNREVIMVGWGKKSEDRRKELPLVLRSASVNLFGQDKCNKSYDISGEAKNAQEREEFLPELFNSKVICAGSSVSYFQEYIRTIGKQA